MRLSKFISKFIFSIAFISTILAFLVSIFFQYVNFETEKEYIRKEFVHLKKEELKSEIQVIFTLLEQKEKLIEKLIKDLDSDRNIEKIRKEIQSDILDWLATYKVGENGYIFVNTFDSKALIWDNKKLQTPIPYPSNELFQLQLDALKTDGFLYYKFKKPNTIQEYEKIAFVKEYKEYGWIIGTGTYLDEIEQEIIRKEAIFKESIQNQIATLLFIFTLILIGTYVITKKLSKYIRINIHNLTSSFEKASKNNIKINTNNLTFKEFISLAYNLNTVLESKNETEKELQDYIDIVNENIIISSTDKDGIITNASKAFCKVSGYTKEELIGNTHRIIRHPDTPKSFYKNMWDTLLSGKEWKGEIKNRNKEGNDYWVLSVIKPVFKNNQIVGFTALRTNITNKKHIEHLSITDELTQLYNRRFFNSKIEEEINRAKRSNKYFSFLIMDIDFFKEYNDTYGHQEGDTALEKVAEVLRKYTNRSSDFAFRLGGEEFGIITTMEREKVFEFGNKIRSEIENLQIEHKNSTISKYLTISIGITSKQGSNITNSNTIYKESDEALYTAKKNGRNCIFLQE